MGRPFDHLPPTTPLIIPTHAEKVAALNQEILALRILLSTVVWKSGGSMAILEADIAHVAMSCKMDSNPIPGGQMLNVGPAGSPLSAAAREVRDA